MKLQTLVHLCSGLLVAMLLTCPTLGQDAATDPADAATDDTTTTNEPAADKPAVEPESPDDETADAPAGATTDQEGEKDKPKEEPKEEPKDEPKEEPKQDPKEEPKQEPKPEPKEKDEPADDKGDDKGDDKDDPAEPTADDFDELNSQWREKLKELVELRDKFRDAEPDQRKEILAQFNAALADGEQILPRLAVAAELRFDAQPEADGEAARFLTEVVRDHMRKENFEEAARLGELLIDRKVEEDGLLELAGIAAFMTNDVDLADRRFAEAEKKGSLGEEAGRLRPDIPYYKKIWKEEQEFRAAETEANDLPRVKLKTNKGDIVVELFENEAPKTVGNFVNLVDKKFYDGITFHRVLPGFMAQAGCPDGDGSGGPGYRIPCECLGDVHRKHFRGTLSMAKQTEPNTGGSQFFLTFAPTRHLDGKHTVFGRVIEGMDVLAKLQRRNPGDPRAPDPDKIVDAVVIRKRDHKYEPTKLPGE